MTKVCSRCEHEKSIEDFYLRNDKRKKKPYRDSMCKTCRCSVTKARRDADPEAHKKAVRVWKDSNPEKVRASNNASRLRANQTRRLEFLLRHGGRCECCGETDPHFLTIDHVGERPEEHKGIAGMALIARIEKTSYPREKWQILCWNCNCAKGRYGACPHQTEVFEPYYVVAA